MLRLKKSARAPENTALKAPELENLCNDRVDMSEITSDFASSQSRASKSLFIADKGPGSYFMHIPKCNSKHMDNL